LNAKGYTVLHSTRHASIEFGKDVIALDPDGVPCAYQLKGNPGSRLTLTQFREIQPQLWQLGIQALVFPGLVPGPHKSFLVTNGTVDEEVHRSIDDMNKTIVSGGGSPISIVQRGQLLAWFGEHASEFWPTEIPELHRIFKLLAAKGNEQPPVELLHQVLMPMLRLDREDGASVTAADLSRRITSTALVVAVCMRSFSQRENHYAIVAAWVLYATYVTAACERFGHDPEKLAARSVAVAEETVRRSLLDLADEAAHREHHIEGDPLTDAAVYRARRSLMVGLMSALWLGSERSGSWPVDGVKENVQAFIAIAQREMELWGEGATPQCLAHIWYLGATDGSLAADIHLVNLLRALIRVQHAGDRRFTRAGPYYTLEDVRRHELAMLTGTPDPFEDDAPRAASSFAEPVFHMLMRRGLKATCKDVWPELTRVAHETFVPDRPWEFCLWRAESGSSVTRMLTYEEQWSNVVEHARCIGVPEVPEFLRERPDLLLLFTLVCPHRATPNVVRYLDHELYGGSWLGEPRSEGVALGT